MATASLTISAVVSGGVWNTPSPNCGIDAPSLRAMTGWVGSAMARSFAGGCDGRVSPSAIRWRKRPLARLADAIVDRVSREQRAQLQRRAQFVEQEAGATLAQAGVVVPVEEGALFGHLQRRAVLAGRHDLHRRQRDGNLLLVEPHLVGIDDSLVGDDVVIDGVEGGDDAAFPA